MFLPLPPLATVLILLLFHFKDGKESGSEDCESDSDAELPSASLQVRNQQQRGVVSR